MAKKDTGRGSFVRVEHAHRWIKTARDGRKFADSSELLRLPRVKEQIRTLREKLKQESTGAPPKTTAR